MPTLQEVIGSDVRVDTLFDKKMICLQPKHGYRYSIDSLLLAHFSSVDQGDVILDMGCGCGIIGIIIMFKWQALVKRVVGLELQPELAELARKNGELNGFEPKYSIREGDWRSIRSYFAAETFSRVVCNPPYYTPSSGRVNADRQSLIARHQVCSSTEQVFEAASYVVKNRGVVSIVFPARGFIELVCAMTKVKLQPKRIRPVYSYPEKEASARLVLVEAIKNGGHGIKIHPPLYIYRQKNGPYSDEMQRLYGLHKESSERSTQTENTAQKG